jgi:mannose-1-phosphate guanylyltransferase
MRAMRHAVILAGGSGTRLWPASRRARPKQFLTLGAPESLLAATARRARAAAPETTIVTAASQAALARAEVPSARVLEEPIGRNTAAALGLAAATLVAHDPDAVMGALPADQHIGDEAGFAAAIERAFHTAEDRDVICTIGIAPTHAETGFGWLELGAPLADAGPDVYDVARFVEKPDAARAEQYFSSGKYLWNGGMFFCRARRLLDEIRAHLPALAAGLDEIVRAPARIAEIYATLPSISIDHGVMEKARGVATVRGDFGWNDVGSWAALPAVRGTDPARGDNTQVGDALFRDARGNIVSTDQGVVVVIGCDDLVVVRDGDAVLVIPRARAQDVRLAVDGLAAAHLDRYL